MFQTNVVEEIETQILFSITFFFYENRTVYDITWKKYCSAGQNAEENMALAHYVLDN
jgi:hypothetical protein